jgi:hypothetical protein
MTNAFRSTISDLASSFAAAVVNAIRAANLQDILEFTAGTGTTALRPGPRGARRGAAKPAAAVAAAIASKAGRKPKGRLQRRSPADIAKALDQVVALIKSKKVGLRAEQIRQHLGMEAREMPRVLKEGLAKKLLKSKGQKRSTTYTAA